jgi:energy-coupling factor transport system ATP-binding protein
VSLIELDGVSFTWPSFTRPALAGIDLRVEAGEYLAVVGSNGSGKSTLLRLFDALLLPSSGKLRVAGLDSANPASTFRIRAACALVFQSPRDQLAASVVEEDAAFGPLNLGLSPQEAIARAESALGAVGLLEERRRPVRNLSAGQQQRLALAGALAMEPRCVCFDEATAMLDPPSRESVLDLMDGLAARGVTVIHVTHDMEEAARARRVIVLEAGRLAFDGSPAELFEARDAGAEPPALALGLELPPVLEFARSVGLAGRVGEGPEEVASRIAALRGPTRVAGDLGPAGDARGPVAPAPDAPSSSLHGGSSDASPPVFRLEKASYSYLRGTEAEVHALEALSFSLPKGASLALVGKTGSGKSSLLQLLDALARPSSGRVYSFGLDTADPKAPLRELRTRAPLAIQRPETALFELYAADDVAFGPRNLGLSGTSLVERVRRWMEAVGLPYGEFRDRPTRRLSGGEKRRLALAGVFALESEALLLDEPSAALDPATRKTVRALIAAARARGVTFVVATHAMEEAAAADLVAVFSRGRLLDSGPPEEIFYGRFDPAWGIGRPRAVELALALRARGVDLKGHPLDLKALALALPAPGDSTGAA